MALLRPGPGKTGCDGSPPRSRDFIRLPLHDHRMDSDAIAAGGIDPPLQRPAASAHGTPLDFCTVYTQHYQPVANYLLRRTGSAHATEDLLGDVFLAVLRALPRYRDRGRPVRHWVFRIANHSANRWLRRRRSEGVALAARADAFRLQADGKEGERAAAARDVARQALAALPRRLQEVAALHYLAELPLDEVAATLRIPLGTVKSRLSRALDRLRSRLPREACQ